MTDDAMRDADLAQAALVNEQVEALITQRQVLRRQMENVDQQVINWQARCPHPNLDPAHGVKFSGWYRHCPDCHCRREATSQEAAEAYHHYEKDLEARRASHGKH